MASEGPPSTVGPISSRPPAFPFLDISQPLVSLCQAQHQPGLRKESGVTRLHLSVTFGALLKEWQFKITQRYYLAGL